MFIRFQKETPRLDLEKLYSQRQKVQGSLVENVDAIECEIRNVEVDVDVEKMCARQYE
jgi:hypothetical protein